MTDFKNPFGQKLMIQGIRKQIPALYAQDNKGDEAIAYAKYFCGGWTWYATEFDHDDTDGEVGRCFGKVYSDLEPDGELGYFSLAELASIQVRGFMVVERDIHFEPTPLKDCKNPCTV